MITGIDLWNIKFSSGHFDNVCLWHLTLEQNVFIGCLVESLTQIECINENYLLTKGVGKIRLLCFKKDGSALLITINNVLYFPKAKANLLSLG